MTASRSDGGPKPVPLRTRNAAGRLSVLFLYCLFIFCCSVFLYRMALAVQSSRFRWVGQGVTVLFILLVAILVALQLVRALSRKRYAHLLFLVLLVLSFFPAYFNLNISMERFHLMLYGVLGMLIFRTLAPARYSLRFYLLSLNLLLAVSVLDEVIQGWVPGRYYDIRDIGINLFSGVIGLLIMRMMDLDAPLPLHPHPNPGHPHSSAPVPLVDLHIFWADLFLVVVPVACLLLFDAAVTRSVKIRELAGVWRDLECAVGIEIGVGESGSVWVQGPGCEAPGTAILEGNALDGYRVRLFEPWESVQDPPLGDTTRCGQTLDSQRPLYVKRASGGRLYLYREDMGRLDRTTR